MERYTREFAEQFAAALVETWGVENAPICQDVHFIEKVSGQHMIAKATLHMDGTVAVKIID